MRRSRWLAVALLLAACGEPPAVVDPDGSVTGDGGASDAGEAVGDGGGSDGGGADAGPLPDGGTVDQDGGADGGLFDAGPMDGGAPDAGATDGGPVDGGADAGPADAGTTDAGSADGGCGLCAAYRPVATVGTIPTVLDEASGLAVSRVNRGVLYAHNDSGGAASIYVFASDGTSLGELRLTGATNHDWEDLAIGPCPTGSCLFVGEIGDNGSNASYPYSVYRVAEPAITSGTSIGTVSVAADRFDLSYPGGAHHNAETLLVHPTTGDVYVVTKVAFGQKSAAYKASAPLAAPPATNVMVKVADLAVPDGLDLPLTGGDIDPCGRAVLLRSYSALYQLVAPSSGFDDAFTAAFTRVPSPQFPAEEGQGEAVAWSPGGGYYSVSEGIGAQLHFVACQ